MQNAPPGRHADGNGLWLQVTQWLAKTGTLKTTRSWLFQYSAPSGKIRQMGLGATLTVSLAEARERAEQARRALRDGQDPIDSKKATKTRDRLAQEASVTFKEAATDYIAAFRPTWKNEKHAEQWTSTLKTYAYPILGQIPVSQIDVDLVCKVLQPIWLKKTETASRVRGRIERVLDRCIVLKQRTDSNPARWRGHLKEIFPPRNAVQRVRNQPALPYAKLPAFMRALRAKAGISARALEFLILTAARTNEVIGARWTEFDLTERIWTIPAERMKARREHRVPLSDTAIDLLESLPREEGNPFVFIGLKGKGLSNMSLLKITRDMQLECVVHGFRSTFRDWAAETTSYPNEVAEKALAHTIKNKAESAYRRGDLLEKRRLLMADWARSLQ